MNIGVISDTHNFLDPKIHELFAGVSHILHAGDIGNATIISELEEIAPATAVHGNTDMNLPFKETEIVILAGRKFLIHHIVNPHAPGSPCVMRLSVVRGGRADFITQGERVRERIAREEPHVVVFGHTHKRFCETMGGILFFNPGYSGKPKLNLERSAAILHCDEKEIRAEFLPL